jgi:hypothetical protein
MRKVSSAEKRPKLRHFFISCGSAKNYLPQEKARNCVTFCTFAEDTPYFSERVAKKTEKSLVSPLCKPPLCVILLLLEIFGGVLPQNPKKARNCVVFAAEDIKKHLPQNAFQKPEKSPKLRGKMIAEDMQRVSSALSSATSADFSLQNLRGW